MSINPCIFHENPTWKDHAQAVAIAVVQSKLGKPNLSKVESVTFTCLHGTERFTLAIPKV